MASDSVNDKLRRVRSPRVHLHYEVETGDGKIEREIPFVVGVLGNFSGHGPAAGKKTLGQRNFQALDRDNFEEVLSAMAPTLNLEVENTLQNDGSKLRANLQFRSMDDFSPDGVVKQVEPLRQIWEARRQLADLLNKMDNSATLEGVLDNLLQNPEKLRELADRLNRDSAGQAEAAKGEDS